MTPAEKRRLALVSRQLTFAQIARREALGGLAGAVCEEQRSRDLALRSRTIADEYVTQGGIEAGAAFAERMRFVGALSLLAGEAEANGAQAARKAESQARTLAGAERRVKSLEARKAEARRVVEAARDRREGAGAFTLARKLHRPSR